MEKMFTSIVIPVYNESTCLKENLRLVDDHLRSKHGENYEIICVDDGSDDGSRAILEDMKDSLPLSIQLHERNRGKGAAIRTGMLASQGDVVFFFDADLSTPLKEMDRFLPRFEEGADVVIGTRKSTSARIKKFQPLHRVIMGLGYTLMVNLIMGMRISDYTCGFKGFTRRAVDAIFPRARIEGWSFDVEILYLAHCFGLRIAEVPVTWENKPGSKVRLVRDTIRSFTEVIEVKRLHKGTGTLSEVPRS